MKLTATPPDIDPRGHYTTAQATEVLGMSRTTFWRLLKRGVIKGKIHTLDGKIRYSGRELLKIYDNYMAELPTPRKVVATEAYASITPKFQL